MHIDYLITGSFPVPEGTTPVAGVSNQFRLPTGEIVSVHPILEMASGQDADDHHDLTHAQAEEHGIALELYHRTCFLVDDE